MDNDKNIYDMLNDIDINLDEYEREDLTDIEKMKIKKAFRENTNQAIKNNNRNRNYTKYITAASIAVVSLAIFSQTTLGVYAYSAISDVVEKIQLGLGVDENLVGYVKSIDQSITKKGLTVSISEVLLDDNELIIAMKYDYNKDLSEDEVVELMRERLYINGKEINYSAKGYNTNINTKSREFIIGYDLGEGDYSGDIKIKIKFMSAAIMSNDSPYELDRISGPWTFKFTANDELRKDTLRIPIYEELNINRGKAIELVEYKENILSNKINIRVDKNNSYLFDESKIVLKGRDDKGNRVDFMIFENGVEDKQDTSKMIYEFVLDNENYHFDKTASKLYLTPYKHEFKKINDEYVSKYIKFGEEFTINIK